MSAPWAVHDHAMATAELAMLEKDRIEILRQENRALIAEYNDAHADRVRLRAELKYQTDNSANLQASIEGLHGRIRELEDELAECRTVKESLMVGRDFLLAEIEKLTAKLAEARKPDCRSCVMAYLSDNGWLCNWAKDSCVDGNSYTRAAPVRLYEKEGNV